MAPVDVTLTRPRLEYIAGLLEGRRALVVGGFGWEAQMVAQLGAQSVRFSSPLAAALRYAGRRCSHSNLELRQATLPALEEGEPPFDVVIATRLPEGAVGRRDLLAAVARSLDPDGFFYLLGDLEPAPGPVHRPARPLTASPGLRAELRRHFPNVEFLTQRLHLASLIGPGELSPPTWITEAGDARQALVAICSRLLIVPEEREMTLLSPDLLSLPPRKRPERIDPGLADVERAELEALETEVQALRAERERIEALEAEIERLRESQGRLAALEAELSEAQQAVEAQAQAAQAQSDTEAGFEQALQSQRQEAAQLKAQLDKQTRREQSLRELVEALQGERDAAIKEGMASRRERDELRQKAEAIASEGGGEALRDSLEAAEARNAELQTESEAVQARCDDLQAEVDLLRAEFDTLRDEADRLRGELSAVKGRHSEQAAEAPEADPAATLLAQVGSLSRPTPSDDVPGSAAEDLDDFADEKTAPLPFIPPRPPTTTLEKAEEDEDDDDEPSDTMWGRVLFEEATQAGAENLWETPTEGEAAPKKATPQPEAEEPDPEEHVAEGELALLEAVNPERLEGLPQVTAEDDRAWDPGALDPSPWTRGEES